jgi:hypothetical protein
MLNHDNKKVYKPSLKGAKNANNLKNNFQNKNKKHLFN